MNFSGNGENEGLDVLKALQMLCSDTPAYQADGQELLLLFGGHSQRSRLWRTHQDWEFCIKLVSGEGSWMVESTGSELDSIIARQWPTEFSLFLTTFSTV